MGAGFLVKQRAGRHGLGVRRRNRDGWKGRKRGVTRALDMFRVAGA